MRDKLDFADVKAVQNPALLGNDSALVADAALIQVSLQMSNRPALSHSQRLLTAAEARELAHILMGAAYHAEEYSKKVRGARSYVVIRNHDGFRLMYNDQTAPLETTVVAKAKSCVACRTVKRPRSTMLREVAKPWAHRLMSRSSRICTECAGIEEPVGQETEGTA